MLLETKPDLDRVLERFDAWFQGSAVDRPLLSLSVRPDKPYELPARKPLGVREAWFDIEGQIERFDAWVRQTAFFAESLPIFFPNLGPDVLATLFGAELDYAPDTSWSHPVVARSAAVRELSPSFDGVYWQTILAMIRASLEAGAGRWITAYTDMHANGDLVSALVGAEDLCLECIEFPDDVRAACEHVTPACIQAYDQQVGLIRTAGQPTTTWLPAALDGRCYVGSCDFSAMLSPEMFEELVMPAMRKEFRAVDRVVYHLDGPSALVHLDTLLAEPLIGAIQWVYGAGQGAATRWLEVYKRIQAAGKGVQVLCESADDAIALASELKPDGVWYSVSGSYSLAEAQSLLDAIAC